MGFVFLRFWKDQCKLVSAVARRGVNGAAVNAQNIGDTADGAAAYKMAVTVVNGLQTIEVQKQHGKRDRKSTRLNSSHLGISYAVFCLKKKKKKKKKKQ